MLMLAAGEECLLMFPCMAGFAVFVGLIIWWASHVQKGRNAAMLEATRKYGGRLAEGGWLQGKVIEFQVDGTPAQLLCYGGSKNSPPYTRAIFRGGIPGALRVRPQGFFMGLRQMFGAQDHQIGDPEFDPQFQIEASSESWARRLLVPEARRILWGLRADSGTLNAGGEAVTVQVRRYLPGDVARTEGFVEMAVELYRVLRRAAEGPAERAAGVEVLQVREDAAGECATCSTPLDAESVACAKCGTAQHKDCWEYLGSCATYGCGGRQHRPVRSGS